MSGGMVKLNCWAVWLFPCQRIKSNQSNFNLVVVHLFPMLVFCMFVYDIYCRMQLQHIDSDCRRCWQSAPCLGVYTADVWFYFEKKTAIKQQRYNGFRAKIAMFSSLKSHIIFIIISTKVGTVHILMILLVVIIIVFISVLD